MRPQFFTFLTCSFDDHWEFFSKDVHISGVLCNKCESRLESGVMTRDGVDAAMSLGMLPDSSKLTKVIVAGHSKRPRVNIEKAVKIAKAVRSIELLVEFENR